MKVVTSVTGWRDSVGLRLSITSSEVDDTTGKILTDNKRTDVVVTDDTVKETLTSLLDAAQTILNNQEA